MRPQTRSKVLWACWMTGGGIATALVVWALTDSVGWALVALLASGPVLNTIGQMVVQPARNGARPRPGPDRLNDLRHLGLRTARRLGARSTVPGITMTGTLPFEAAARAGSRTSCSPRQA